VAALTTLFVDLGGVLVTVDLAAGCRRIAQLAGGGDPEAIREVMLDGFQPALSSGKMSVEDFHAGVCRRLGLEIGLADFSRAYADIFAPIEGTWGLLRMAQRRYRLHLLSNTDPLHFRFIADVLLPGRFDLFGHLVLSYEAGHLKPSPEIYLAALERCGEPAQSCLFIDDLEVNVEGARAVGMQGIVFRSPEKLARDLVRAAW
jgi:putative hydrolase of the HAD superfamily